MLAAKILLPPWKSGATMEAQAVRRVHPSVLTGIAILAAVFSALSAEAARSTFRKTWSFERDPAGQPPAGFSLVLTGHGAAGRWTVVDTTGAPSGTHILAQPEADTTAIRFPLAIEDTLLIADLRATVKCRLVSGRVAQACGLVFRYQDESNYYFARADALQGRICLYYVKDGTQGEVKCRSAAVSAGSWHEMRVEGRGYHFEIFWDGKKVLSANDGKIGDTGRIGVRTESDTVAEFDDLAVEPPE